ncbi:ABC transporter substrate-binding protein [Brevibacillus migulae]|uniref:ABC transporter substrate-binding protein n=1 Tax=Brevibacillus migulae TaxID=1644114 RepID=UPI0014306E59|nr:ABC transporter substrate-binding protein [Brevibacillus migulae]
MSAIDDYIRLHQHAGVRAGEVEISLEEISHILCCTPRNSKLIIKKLAEQHWLIWKPGRGRGNRSQLRFLTEPAELLFGQAKELVVKGKINEALTLCQAYQSIAPDLPASFQAWLRSRFGFHLEKQEERLIDTLRMRLNHTISSLDPAFASYRSESHLIKQIYDSLVRYNPETQRMEPHLAHAWEHNERGDEWTFYLRKGVLFHHGQLLTADDVAFSLERIRCPQTMSPYRWMLDVVSEIRAVHDYKLTIKLERPHFMLPELLGSEQLSILCKTYVDRHGEAALKNPVGTGPFKLMRCDDSMVVLSAFDAYFRERAHLDRIELLIVPDGWFEEETANATSSYGILYADDDGQVERKQQSHAESLTWRQTERTVWSVQYVTFNTRKKGPMANQRFREALRLILQPADLLRERKGGLHQVAAGFLPDPIGTTISTTSEQPERNPFELLQELGQQEWNLRLHTYPDQDHREDSAWITERCAQYGITVTTQFFAHPDLLQDAVVEEADLIHDSATIDERVELSFLNICLMGDSFIRRYMDAELMEQIRWEAAVLFQSTLQERRTILQRIERLLLESGFILPLYREHLHIRSRPELQGVEMNAQGWIEYRPLWVKR